MVVEHLHQVIHIEELVRSGAGERLFDALVVQVGLQPHGQRRDERLLGHVRDLLREAQVGCRTAQRVLRVLIGNAAVGGQLQRHIEHLLVQEGNAQLKGVRHGHAVGLQANVIGHVGDHVHVLRLRDDVAAARLHRSLVEVRLAPFPWLARAVIALQHVGDLVPHVVHARALIAFLRAARTAHGEVTPVERRQLLSNRAAGRAQRTGHLEVLGELVLVVVDPVAAEQLVGALAGLHHLHLFGGKLADEVQRNGRRRTERLVHVVLLGGNDIQELLGRDLHVLVGKPRPLGELARIFELVQLDLEAGVLGLVALLLAAGDVVAHGERLHALVVMLAHAVRGQRAVDAAGQEAADLHVGDLMGAHALVERVLDDVGPFLKTLGTVDLVGDLVEALDGGLAVLEHHEMTGRHLVDVLEHGLRVVHVLEAQVLRKGLAVQLLLETRVRQEGLDLAAPDQTIALMLIVQRLDTEDVARKHQLLFLSVPNGDGEHAAQALEHARAPGLIAMHDGLGVAVGLKLVAHTLKLGTQLLEIVDLAVERDSHAAIGVLHGLVAALKVDDGQAAKAHSHIIVYEKALIIRAAMDNAIRHVLDDGAIDALVEINGGESHESAHALESSFSYRFADRRLCIRSSYATDPPYGHFPRNARHAYVQLPACAIMQGCIRYRISKEIS